MEYEEMNAILDKLDKENLGNAQPEVLDENKADISGDTRGYSSSRTFEESDSSTSIVPNNTRNRRSTKKEIEEDEELKKLKIEREKARIRHEMKMDELEHLEKIKALQATNVAQNTGTDPMKEIKKALAFVKEIQGIQTTLPEHIEEDNGFKWEDFFALAQQVKGGNTNVQPVNNGIQEHITHYQTEPKSDFQ